MMTNKKAQNEATEAQEGQKQNRYPLSDAQVNNLKKQHETTKVHEYECEGKYAYLRDPGFNDISHAVSMGGKNGMKVNDIIAQNIFLEGDPEFKNDTGYRMALCQFIDEIVQVKEGNSRTR